MTKYLKELRELNRKMDIKFQRDLVSSPLKTSLPFDPDLDGSAILVKRSDTGDWVYIAINKVLADINGAPIEAHIGASVKELWPGLAEVAYALFNEVESTGRPLVDYRLDATTDSEKKWLVTYQGIKARDGTVMAIGALVRLVHDD